MRESWTGPWLACSSGARASAVWLILCAVLAAQGERMPMELTVGGKALVGTRLAEDHRALWLLRPDGRVTQVDVRRVEGTRTLPASAMRVSMDAVRLQLVDEFGEKYQVSKTQHYLVVHPPGDHQRWAAPFETMFHRFQAFFERRGLALGSPEFPLVAVVLNTREEFDRFLARHRTVNSQVVGYYSPTSNRIITYRDAGRPATGTQGFVPSQTIIHECAHQAAFNTGIHARFAPTPKWLSEGLATLFETPGVYDSLRHGRLADRIHAAHRATLASAIADGQLGGKLRELVESDQLFDRDPQLAYALAWGMTFYLVETQPHAYQRLLRTTSEKPAFQAYAAAARVRDFQVCVGALPESIEANVWQYLSALEGK